jgi:hypothetical protein
MYLSEYMFGVLVVIVGTIAILMEQVLEVIPSKK